jgi:hypothetical protein
MARTLDYPPRAFVSTHLIETGVFVQEGGENVSSFRSFSLLMQATPRCTIVALLAVMLASCAWQPTLDHAHALSEMADKSADDSAKCQSSGAALGSQAYKQCRALLEDKMSIENDVPRDRGYTRTRP